MHIVLKSSERPYTYLYVVDFLFKNILIFEIKYIIELTGWKEIKYIPTETNFKIVKTVLIFFKRLYITGKIFVINNGVLLLIL